MMILKTRLVPSGLHLFPEPFKFYNFVSQAVNYLYYIF